MLNSCIIKLIHLQLSLWPGSVLAAWLGAIFISSTTPSSIVGLKQNYFRDRIGRSISTGNPSWCYFYSSHTCRRPEAEVQPFPLALSFRSRLLALQRIVLWPWTWTAALAQSEQSVCCHSPNIHIQCCLSQALTVLTSHSLLWQQISLSLSLFAPHEVLMSWWNSYVYFCPTIIKQYIQQKSKKSHLPPEMALFV